MDSKLALGVTVQTAGVAENIHYTEVLEAIVRHMKLDYGDLCPEDCEVNNDCLADDSGLVMSSYVDSKGEKFWIITDFHASEDGDNVTTVLLPSEY